MVNQDRRKFIKLTGKTLLVTSGIAVFGLASAKQKTKSSDEYYFDGYYDDGYYDDGYYDDGYTTGLSDVEAKSIKMNIFPNPSNGSFHLSIDNKNTELTYIYIYDLSGKTIFQENQMLLQGNNQISFQLNNLLKGMYVLNVITENGDFGSLRLLIVK